MDKKKERIALRKSIKHWCLDIRRPLLSGDTIFFSTWKNSGRSVKMFSNSCSLCKTYNNCNGCPLYDIGESCDEEDSAYNKFWNLPNLRSANNMIAVLMKCYRGAL